MYRSSYFWPDEPDEQAVFDWRRSRLVRVGHDTWIGHGAIVMKGVTIGNGAIIGAQSVVTKDVPPYAVVAGAPARHIKWRHPRQVADRLQALAWWDWTHEEICTAPCQSQRVAQVVTGVRSACTKPGDCVEPDELLSKPAL